MKGRDLEIIVTSYPDYDIQFKVRHEEPEAPINIDLEKKVVTISYRPVGHIASPSSQGTCMFSGDNEVDKITSGTKHPPKTPKPRLFASNRRITRRARLRGSVSIFNHVKHL